MKHLKGIELRSKPESHDTETLEVYGDIFREAIECGVEGQEEIENLLEVNGLKDYNSFVNLPYLDASRCALVDAMHLLSGIFNGIFKLLGGESSLKTSVEKQEKGTHR